MTFVTTVADLAVRPQNNEVLLNCGVLQLLCPLLTDVVPSIQQKAAIALGWLANISEKVADSMVQNGILEHLLVPTDNQNKHFKRAALFTLRAVSKHSPELANQVVKSGGLHMIIDCLEDFDATVKENAACALGNIARHNQDLAQAVMNAGALPLLYVCLREPELSLKLVAANTISDISKHSLDLASSVKDTGCITHLVKALSNPDVKLRRQALLTLANIAKHSKYLIEVLIEAQIFPTVLVLLGNEDDLIKRYAATLVKEIVKHSFELSVLVVNSGGLAALINVIATSKHETVLPEILAVEFIAAQSAELAIGVINSNGVQKINSVLLEETKDHILAGIVWTLGQIVQHSYQHAQAIADNNLFPKILQLYLSPKSSDDLKQKSKASLKLILHKCTLWNNYCTMPLQKSSSMLRDSSARSCLMLQGLENCLSHPDVLERYKKSMLRLGSTLMECITVINLCYPEEIVRYYSPVYTNEVLQIIDLYSPNIPNNLIAEIARQTSTDSVPNESMRMN